MQYASVYTVCKNEYISVIMLASKYRCNLQGQVHTRIGGGLTGELLSTLQLTGLTLTVEEPDTCKA